MTKNMQQIKLPETQALLPPRAGVSPIAKWAGGKSWLVSTIVPSIYERLAVTRGRYIEPFLGGGAIALDLGLPHMILSDVCKPLITTYLAVRKSPTAVMFALRDFVDRGTDQASYLRVRSINNGSHISMAARFLYLNTLCFNGLYRENKSGGFNVPYGRNADGSCKTGFPTLGDLQAVTAAFTTADISLCDFTRTVAKATEGDVVYADPPYLGTFSNYAAGGFSDEDHWALANALEQAHLRGATVISSNSDHPRIRELYHWATITSLAERHGIGAKANRRGMKPAVLILSDPLFLRGT